MDRRGGYFEGVGDLEDVCERHVALAALNVAVVPPVQAAPEREPLLTDAALAAQLTDRFAERCVGGG